MEKLRRNKGITLVALVITIIILLILAGVSIQAITNTGLFTNAKKAQELSNEKLAEEKIKLILSEWVIKNTAEGTTLEEFLSEKLEENQIQDFEYDEENENYEVVIDKQIITINKNGEILSIEQSGPRPIISEIKIVNIKGEEIPKKSIEVGSQKIYIKFKASIENGNIEQVRIQDKEVSLENEQYSYEVSENGNYTFEITGKANEKTYSKNRTIVINQYDTLPSQPIINSSFGYSTLTAYGIETKNIISIKFDENDETKNYYSFDEKNWEEYKGEINADANQTIYAKSVKTGGLSTSSNKIISVPIDAMGVQAFDGNDDTGWKYTYGSNNVGRVNIDNSMWGEKIRIKFNSNNMGYNGGIKIYDKNNDLLSTIGRETGTYDLIVNIPENAEYLQCFKENGGGIVTIYEINIANEPQIKHTEIIPKIYRDKIEVTYWEVSIKFNKTSVRREWQINDEGWKNYNGEIIKIKIGDTIQARGYDENGIQTRIISKDIASLKENSMGLEAFDGNDDTGWKYTYGSNKVGRVNIDNSMWGEKIRIKFNSNNMGYNGGIKIYDKNNDLLSTIGIETGTYDLIVNIPENAEYLQCFKENGGGIVTIYEISIVKN